MTALNGGGGLNRVARRWEPSTAGISGDYERAGESLYG